jgi:hypothetical protein
VVSYLRQSLVTALFKKSRSILDSIADSSIQREHSLSPKIQSRKAYDCNLPENYPNSFQIKKRSTAGKLGIKATARKVSGKEYQTQTDCICNSLNQSIIKSFYTPLLSVVK